MKKFTIIMLVIISLALYNNSTKSIKIPDDAIRFRILANSNSPYDQKLKEDIKEELQTSLYNLLKDTKELGEAKSLIKNNINNFDTIVNKHMENQKYKYTIDYGIHSFPEKKYKGVIYEAGNYESLLVTLGTGKGDNWWCVLFPPLCLIEAEESTEVEYKSFIKELIEKYF
ncbi:MAG: stage II sporulation protein R [Bacilli bacterium]